MAKIFHSGFDLGFVSNDQCATGWSVATTSPRFVENPRIGAGENIPPGLAFNGVLTFTGPATSFIGASKQFCWPSLAATNDIVSFGSVILRLTNTAGGTLVIRNNGADVATVALAAVPAVGAYVPFEFSITLSTGGAAAATFKLNGTTATWSAGTTTGATATTLTLSNVNSTAGSSAFDDLCINDGTGAVDNGIPPLAVSFLANLTGSGTPNNFSVGGARCVKVNRGGMASTVRMARPVYSSSLDAFFAKPLTITESDGTSGPGFYVRTEKATGVQSNLILSTADVGSLNFLALIGNSTTIAINVDNGTSWPSNSFPVNLSTGARAANLSNNATTSNYVVANGYIVGGLTTGGAGNFRRYNLDWSGLTAISGAANSNTDTLSHYSPISDRVYVNSSSTANAFSLINVVAGTATAIAGPASQYGSNATGWIEDTANSRLYFIGTNGGNGAIVVFNTATNAFVKTIALTGKVTDRTSNTRLCSGSIKSFTADFTNNRIFVATTGGEVLSVNTATDVVTSLTTAPVFNSIAPLLARVGTKLLVFSFDRYIPIDLTTNTVGAAVLYPNVLQNAANTGSFRIYTDGSYYFIPQNTVVAFFDPSINNFLTETSKLRTARNFIQSSTDTTSANQLSTLRGNKVSATGQNYTFDLNGLTATRVLNVSIAAPNSSKAGSLSADLQLGLKTGGVDYQAGTNITPPASPNTNLVRRLPYKTGTTEFTPGEISSAEAFAKVV